MLIAKLTVGVENTGISYNKSDELKTEVARGQVLDNGHVIRGLGTSYVSKEAEARHKYLTQLAAQVRQAFSYNFLRAPLDSTFVINKKGDGIEWRNGTTLTFTTGSKKDKTFKEEQLKVDSIPGLNVSVSEYDLGRDESMEDKEVREWAARIKDQLTRFKLGRGKSVDEDSLSAIERLIDCPVIAEESKDAVRAVVNQLRVGTLDRQNFKRNISLLEVKMEQAPMMAPRSRPAEAATEPQS